MKTYILIIAIVSGNFLSAQSFNGIKNARVVKDSDGQHVYFTLNQEANVSAYIIEGSNDSANFEIVNSFRSKGNTVVPRTYEYLSVTETYAYYRIKQMNFDGSVANSVKICAEKVVRPADNAPSAKPATAHAIKM